MNRRLLLLFLAGTLVAGGFRAGWFGVFAPSRELRYLDDAPALRVRQAGDYEHAIDVGGRSRRYELHIPAGFRPQGPVPVVMFLHGFGGSAEMSRSGTGFDRWSDELGFVMVYPDGTASWPWSPRSWNAGACCDAAVREGIDDVAFLRKVLADLRLHLDVDPERVFVAGFSNGAMMSHRLACELPEEIAAIASVSGTLSVTACAPSAPVRVLHVHATGDEEVPYEPRTPDRPFAGVRETVALWARVNGCEPVPAKTRLADRVWLETYAAGTGAVTVSLVTLEGGKHFWPSTSERVRREVPADKFFDFDATRYICGFFGLQ